MNRPLSHHETIVPREHLDFRIDETIPRYWFRGDAYKTRFFDAVQSGFPTASATSSPACARSATASRTR